MTQLFKAYYLSWWALSSLNNLAVPYPLLQLLHPHNIFRNVPIQLRAKSICLELVLKLPLLPHSSKADWCLLTTLLMGFINCLEQELWMHPDNMKTQKKVYKQSGKHHGNWSTNNCKREEETNFCCFTVALILNHCCSWISVFVSPNSSRCDTLCRFLNIAEVLVWLLSIIAHLVGHLIWITINYYLSLL